MANKSIQELFGIKRVTEHGVETVQGTLVFFRIEPTNLSVLSKEKTDEKIKTFMYLLSAESHIDILCMDSAEGFDENKAYLDRRAAEETNEKVRAILRKDGYFFDETQMEMASARAFYLTIRYERMTESEVFRRTNQTAKTIGEYGFDVSLLTSTDIRKLLGIYLGTSTTGDQISDMDGTEYFAKKRHCNLERTVV